MLTKDQIALIKAEIKHNKETVRLIGNQLRLLRANRDSIRDEIKQLQKRIKDEITKCAINISS